MNNTNQRRTIALVISIQAPPAPKCFESRDRWVIYLESAQAARKPGRKPFEGGQYRPGFDFCVDCSPSHRALMAGQLRCAPRVYAASLAGKADDVATVEVVSV